MVSPYKHRKGACLRMTGNPSWNSVSFSQMQSTENAEWWSLSFLFQLSEVHISNGIRESPPWQVGKYGWSPYMVSKECVNDAWVSLPGAQPDTAVFPVLDWWQWLCFWRCSEPDPSYQGQKHLQSQHWHSATTVIVMVPFHVLQVTGGFFCSTWGLPTFQLFEILTLFPVLKKLDLEIEQQEISAVYPSKPAVPSEQLFICAFIFRSALCWL